jgi:hypothetical protein
MSRKISNDVLKSVLTNAKRLIEDSIKHQRWMATTCLDAVNFGSDTTRLRKEREASIIAIEESARTSRDIDHALAALEQETDDV